MSDENEVVEEEENFDDLWANDVEEEEGKPLEEEKPKEEEEEEKEEEPKEEEVKKEEPKDKLSAARERLRAKRQAQLEAEREAELEQEKDTFDDDDFADSMGFTFPKRSIEVDGEQVRLDDIARENPEIAALIKYAIGVQRKQVGLDIDGVKGYINKQEFWNKVEAKAPGARNLGDNEDFIKWIQDQDEDIQTLVQSSDPDDVVMVIEAWNEFNTPTKKEDTPAVKKKKGLLKKGTKSVKSSVPSSVDDGELTEELLQEIWGE